MGGFFPKDTNLNLAVITTDIDNAAMALAGGLPIADCEAEHGPILVRFIRALAMRQARLDIELAYSGATGNEPRTLH